MEQAQTGQNSPESKIRNVYRCF